MYRLLSERARFRLLARVCAGHGLRLSGCWLRAPRLWRWRSEESSTQPKGGYFYHWSSLGVRLLSPTRLSSEGLGEVRRNYRKALARQARKCLLHGWAKSLKCQRTSLAQQLHRGLCQAAMLLDLQSHWLTTCPPPERPQAQQDLLESVSTMTTDFSRFFQEQLASGAGSDEADGLQFAANAIADQFFRELLLTSRALDRNVQIEGGLYRMTLRFECTQKQRAPLAPLLYGLKCAGIRVKASPTEVALSFH